MANIPENLKVLVVGANSAIAKEVVRRYAEAHAELYLIGRDEARLERLAGDVEIRGARLAGRGTLDVLDLDEIVTVIDKAFSVLGTVDVVLVAVGSLPDQKACEADIALARRELTVNGTAIISIIHRCALRLAEQKSGCIAVITSVAGDRGRQSNYLYGSSKALVSTYLQGLRNQLFPLGVNVVDIRPGLIDTPMTSEFPKGPLWATPETIAAPIIRAIARKRHVAYVPWYWLPIMLIVRSIPETIFKRLKL